MGGIENLKVKIYSDGADVKDFEVMNQKPYIKGFTTNPTLMKKAGVSEYEKFVTEVMPIVGDKSISFEVISDDFAEMKRQAVKLSKFGSNVFVKIPIMNTKRESSVPLVGELVKEGIKVNVTAIMTLKQVEELVKVLDKKTPSIVSIFAGRIADTGLDPIPLMKKAAEMLKELDTAELLWASPRELLNIFQAEEANCDIVTVPPEILKKLSFVGYDLETFSLDTVKMFYNDAVSSGLSL